MNPNQPPNEIRTFNFAALFFNWIWAIRYRVWWGLLSLVPILGLLVAVALGLWGNEWAWKKNSFSSPDKFLREQRTWLKVGFFLIVLLVVFGFVLFKIFPNLQGDLSRFTFVIMQLLLLLVGVVDR